MQPDAIKAWASEVRAGTNGGFQLNLWIPDPPPARDEAAEAAVRAFLGRWGPAVPRCDGRRRRCRTSPPSARRCWRRARRSISSIMGLYPPDFVGRMKARGVRWFATVTTVARGAAAEAAGADAIVAQGMEAGGHRGAFDAGSAETAAGRAVRAAAGGR